MSTKPVAPEVLLPVCTLSYPNLFTPKVAPGSTTPKYSMAAVFPPEIVAALKEVKEECGKLLLAKYGTAWIDAVKAGQLHWPFKSITGLAVKPGYPEGGVLVNLNAQADSPPHLFSRYADPTTGKAQVITDPKVLYAGCQVKVLVRPYLFDVGTKKGVTLGLQAVQWWADGPRLDGRSNPIDKFAAEEAPAAGMPGAPGTVQNDDAMNAMLHGDSGAASL